MAPRRGFFGSRKYYGSKKVAKKSKPFRKYKNPSTCKSYKKINCGSVDPNCGWRKKVGCVHRKKSRRTPGIYQGPANRMM